MLTMANFKKMDDHDFVFVNKPMTVKEEKEFSDFLKSRKIKAKSKQKTRVRWRCILWIVYNKKMISTSDNMPLKPMLP